jgi:hypothetical protein
MDERLVRGLQVSFLLKLYPKKQYKSDMCFAFVRVLKSVHTPQTSTHIVNVIPNYQLCIISLILIISSNRLSGLQIQIEIWHTHIIQAAPSPIW